MSLYLGTNEICPTKISNDTYGWLGPDTKYVGKLYEWTGTLSDTTYSSWDPSTTAGTVLSALSNVASFEISDRTVETAYVVCRWDMNFVYNSGATMTATPLRYSFASVYSYYNYPNNLSQYQDGNYTAYSSTSLISCYYLQYYNTSGTLTGGNTSYGPAYTTSAPSWSTSTSGDKVTVTLNRQALSARCSSSYFSTDRASEINVSQSTLKCRIDLFKGPIEHELYHHRYSLITDIYNNNWNF